MKQYCCACQREVKLNLCTGADIYPGRRDLRDLLFWQCPTCRNYVGCHKGSKFPLGVVPTPAIRQARMKIHRLIDPLWKGGKLHRRELYKKLSEALGYEYHTANIRSLNQADSVYRTAKELFKEYI